MAGPAGAGEWQAQGAGELGWWCMEAWEENAWSRDWGMEVWKHGGMGFACSHVQCHHACNCMALTIAVKMHARHVQQQPLHGCMGACKQLCMEQHKVHGASPCTQNVVSCRVHGWSLTKVSEHDASHPAAPGHMTHAMMQACRSPCNQATADCD